MSSRSTAGLLVLLIALGCMCGVQFVRAEGPFDVDNATGGNKTLPTSTIGHPQPGDPSGDDGVTAPTRAASVVGGDWFTGFILRVSFNYAFDHWIVKPATTPRQNAALPAAFRGR
ncbi:MAG TPA: hypothetical protein PK186_11235 [candidate division Zixibacteria bacterium]|nr:hypothetical protein [candidate division Zixibacteria bacterium]MDD4917880.1 hypothetical protein [candidate division Zixibacteria bacterium]MDM7973508.1 hypothetical protein [candidate division Zixibacteria bacterium]HOD67268.1 hypothetical protein [candidate division Zixibacteria bacterium]HPM38118.1 hypothetical protein [candidate division Zixibacteria bacterium]